MLQLNFSPFPELTTERLLLREMLPSDAEAIYAVRLDGVRPRTKEEIVELIERTRNDLRNNLRIGWSVVLKATGEVIGEMWFWRIEPEHHRAEIGYSFRNNHQRKGYATEALGAVIKYGFDGMKLHSIEGNTNPENIASITVMKRHGFQQEGYLRENYFTGGKFRDTMRFSLLTPHR